MRLLTPWLLATLALCTGVITNHAFGDDASPTKPAGHVARIVIIGDSTVCDYDTTKTIQRGWGQELYKFVGPDVKIDNMAHGGRSSKSYIREGWWKKVKALDPKPDFVLIQFGHNDNPGKGPKRETLTGSVPDTLPDDEIGNEADDYYRNNIRKYIQESRAMGATPVVVSPMERRHFDDQDHIEPLNQPYAQAARAVAEQLHAPFIPLNQHSVAVYEKMGPEASKEIQMSRHGKLDNTHYNERGATMWAKWIAQQMQKKVPAMKGVLVIPDQAVSS